MDILKSQNYIAEHRTETINNLCRFMLTDVLLFWSDKPDLEAYQKAHWQPILNRLNAVFKLDLQTTTNLTPAENRSAQAVLSELLTAMPDKELTGCFLASAATKSVLLGLLMAKKNITATEAFNAAFLEEIYQNRAWGTDVVALNARRQTESQLKQIEVFLDN